MQCTHNTYSAFSDTNRALTIHGSLGSLYLGVSILFTPHSQSHLLAIAQHLSIPMLQRVNHWHNLRVFLQSFFLLLRYQTPQFINIDRRPPILVPCKMEMPHTNLTKVTRVVLVKVDPKKTIMKFFQNPRRAHIHVPVVVCTTSKTTSSRMLAVLAYTTISSRHMPTMFSSIRESCRHSFLQTKY